jgi:hypothetical protein
MTKWLVSTTGTHHVPAILDHASGTGKSVCGRWAGDYEDADPDPDEVCSACRQGRGTAYGGVDPEDPPGAEHGEGGRPADDEEGEGGRQ